MKMLHALTLCSLIALSACERAEESQAVSTEASAPMMAPADAAAPEPTGSSFQGFKTGGQGGASDQTISGEAYIYDHNITVSMSSGFIKARFERARDRCQNDAALKCKITAASYRVLGEPDAPLPVANLSVSLPRESVTAFEASLLEVLPDEDKDDVVVKSRNTSAQNVTNQVRDIEARLSQLTNYRNRMQELAKRKNATTDDLIKIEGEISRTQADIEQIEGQRRDLAERIAKENLSISFEALSTTSDAFQPVRDVWQGSWRLLAESAAGALGLVVGIIPWLPILLGAFFGFRFLWRRSTKV